MHARVVPPVREGPLNQVSDFGIAKNPFWYCLFVGSRLFSYAPEIRTTVVTGAKICRETNRHKSVFIFLVFLVFLVALAHFVFSQIYARSLTDARCRANADMREESSTAKGG